MWCDSAFVAFPLELLSPVFEERAELWATLDMSWRVMPIQPDHGKPVVNRLESAAWLVEVAVWSSGEAELATIRLTDDHIAIKHYDLVGRGDLATLFDERASLLVDGEVPEAAVVGYV